MAPLEQKKNEGRTQATTKNTRKPLNVLLQQKNPNRAPLPTATTMQLTYLLGVGAGRKQKKRVRPPQSSHQSQQSHLPLQPIRIQGTGSGREDASFGSANNPAAAGARPLVAATTSSKVKSNATATKPSTTCTTRTTRTLANDDTGVFRTDWKKPTTTTVAESLTNRFLVGTEGLAGLVQQHQQQRHNNSTSNNGQPRDSSITLKRKQRLPVGADGLGNPKNTKRHRQSSSSQDKLLPSTKVHRSPVHSTIPATDTDSCANVPNSSTIWNDARAATTGSTISSTSTNATTPVPAPLTKNTDGGTVLCNVTEKLPFPAFRLSPQHPVPPTSTLHASFRVAHADENDPGDCTTCSKDATTTATAGLPANQLPANTTALRIIRPKHRLPQHDRWSTTTAHRLLKASTALGDSVVGHNEGNFDSLVLPAPGRQEPTRQDSNSTTKDDSLPQNPSSHITNLRAASQAMPRLYDTESSSTQPNTLRKNKKSTANENFVRLNLRNKAGSCRGARKTSAKAHHSRRHFTDSSSMPNDSNGRQNRSMEAAGQVMAAKSSGIDIVDDFIDGVFDKKAPKEAQQKGLKKVQQKAIPLCTGHQQPCKLLTVKKTGANKGRKFYACPFPRGEQCQHFVWADDTVQVCG